MDDPQVLEATASVAVGGKVQVKKFEISSDFSYYISRKYAIPADWSEDQVDKFQMAKAQYLRDLIEDQAQKEFDDLFEQKARLND